jgi:hypothetical protein
MKNIISAIQKIKGVTTVESVNNLVIAICEPQNKPILITEDGVPLFCSDDQCWWVDLENLKKGVQSRIFPELSLDDKFKYFSTKRAAKEYIAMQKAVDGMQSKIGKLECEVTINTDKFIDSLDAMVFAFSSMLSSKEKPTNETIKCDTQEQWDFMVAKFDKDQKEGDPQFGGTSSLGNIYNLIVFEENGQIGGKSEVLAKKEGDSIIPFADFIKRESLVKEWEGYLLVEAEKRGFVIGVKHKGQGGTGCFEINQKLYFLPGLLIFGGETGCIYCDGQWAEIIPAPVKVLNNFINLKDLNCGNIYIDMEGVYSPRIIRFKGLSGKRVDIYSQLMSDKDYSGEIIGYGIGQKIRPATYEEKTALIRAEVAHNYFHGIPPVSE